MDQLLAILLVGVVAAELYGVSYQKKKAMYPDCDRFAEEY